MRAIHVQATMHHSRRTADIDFVHRMILAVYLVASAGTAVLAYLRMLDVLGDPMPAAIITLILALIVIVATNRGATTIISRRLLFPVPCGIGPLYVTLIVAALEPSTAGPDKRTSR